MSWLSSEWTLTARPILAAAGLVGGVLFIASAWFRTPDAPPVASLNPRNWVPIWKTRHWYRPPGYSLATIGLGIFSLCGIALSFIGFFG